MTKLYTWQIEVGQSADRWSFNSQQSLIKEKKQCLQILVMPSGNVS